MADEKYGSVTVGNCVCEMAQWLQWEHRGRMVAVDPVELAVMDAAVFRSLVKRTPAFHHCQEYALCYPDRIMSACGGPDNLTDIWEDEDVLRVLANHAFARVDENGFEEKTSCKSQQSGSAAFITGVIEWMTTRSERNR